MYDSQAEIFGLNLCKIRAFVFSSFRILSVVFFFGFGSAGILYFLLDFCGNFIAHSSGPVWQMKMKIKPELVYMPNWAFKPLLALFASAANSLPLSLLLSLYVSISPSLSSSVS